MDNSFAFDWTAKTAKAVFQKTTHFFERSANTLVIPMALALLSNFSAQAFQENSAQPIALYTVVSCNDGDTCRLTTPDNITIKVRLVGIDAPEFKGKKKNNQPMSEESKNFLNNLVKGKKVKLNSYGTDGFNRNLAELLVDDKIANLELVKSGLAEVYRGRPPKGFSLKNYELAEKEAKDEKKGVWSLSNYQSPKDFRKKNR